VPSFIHELKIRVRDGVEIDFDNLINLVCVASLSERQSITREASSSQAVVLDLRFEPSDLGFEPSTLRASHEDFQGYVDGS